MRSEICSKCKSPLGDNPDGNICRPCIRARHTAWRKKYPRLNSIYRLRSVAKAMGVENTFTYEEWLEILAAHEGRCAYCNAQWEHIEHIVPMAKGGANAAYNVVPACASCNWKKARHHTWEPRYGPRAKSLQNTSA